MVNPMRKGSPGGGCPYLHRQPDHAETLIPAYCRDPVSRLGTVPSAPPTNFFEDSQDTARGTEGAWGRGSPTPGGCSARPQPSAEGGPAPLAEVPHQSGILARDKYWCGTSFWEYWNRCTTVKHIRCPVYRRHRRRSHETSLRKGMEHPTITR